MAASRRGPRWTPALPKRMIRVRTVIPDPAHKSPAAAWRPALAVLVLGLGLSGVVAEQLWRWAARDDAVRTETQALGIKEAIDGVSERYQFGLARLQGFFAARPEIDPAAWETELTLLNLDVDFPAAIELGYAPWVGEGKSELEGFAAGFRRGNPGKALPDIPVAGEKLPLMFHHTRSEAGSLEHGFDFRIDGEDRWQPVSDAILTAEMHSSRLTRSVTRVEGRAVPGLRWFWPVYKDGSRIRGNPSTGDTARVRAAAVRGIVFATVDVERMLVSEFGKVRGELAMRWYDGPEPSAAQCLNNTVLAPSPEVERRPADFRLSIPWYGQRWTVLCWRLPLFNERSSRDRAFWALGAGTLVSLAMAGFVWIQSRSRVRAQRDAAVLRRTNDRLAAALKDREQLSRDLHDNTLQNLYAIGLDLQYCRELAGDRAPDAAERLGRDAKFLDSVVFELRQVLLSLRTDVLEGGTLVPVLEALAERLTVVTGCDVSVEVEPAASANLPPGTALHLVNFAREAMSNSIRHGRARRIELRLTGDANRWEFEVEDDGIGFAATDSPPGGGHGLGNMRARAEELDAEFRLDSDPGKGTRIVLSYPRGRR